ncbi:MAG: DoxX family membrane protein [Polyangiaceae bacterium]
MTTTARRAPQILRVLLAAVMIGAGVLHFAQPAGFVKIVPRFLPAPYFLVLLSGGFEILGGVGLLVPRSRRFASFGLIALFVAVLPANINMAVNDIQPATTHIPTAFLWLRLPLQALLVAWAWWVGRREPL